MSHAEYTTAIVQLNGSPFTYDHTLKAKAKRIVAGKHDGVEKSRAIYEWIRQNILYDNKKERRRGIDYRGALETFNDRKGVCGELAALQITMERLVGEKAFYVKMNFGEKLHACAAHVCPNGDVMLIEMTEDNGYNVQYTDFELVSDEHVSAGYK